MMRRQAGGWIAMPAGVLLWAAVTGSGAAQAAGIKWETNGPFQACLETQAKQWVDGRAELVANEDPAAAEIADPAVAAWTIQALKDCEAKAGRVDPASQQLFMRHMAHWREHIDAAAAAIKRKVRPD